MLLPNAIILKSLPPPQRVQQLHAAFWVATWAKGRHHHHADFVINPNLSYSWFAVLLLLLLFHDYEIIGCLFSW